ncbi:MAG: transcription termination/antitermination NusG family protein [Thomasclavelia ramosa]
MKKEMGDKMYWYIAHVKIGQANKLVSSLNKQENIEAFIPKKEQWYRARDKRTYVIKELYPDYVFIKSKLNKDEFDKKFKVFRTIED